jgi:hypothetical protein
LAGHLRVSATTVAIFEISKRWSPKLDLERARAVLESAGVIFVEENGEGPGVRPRKGAWWSREGIEPLPLRLQRSPTELQPRRAGVYVRGL